MAEIKDARRFIVAAIRRLQQRDLTPKLLWLPAKWKGLFGEGPILGLRVRYCSSDLGEHVGLVCAVDLDEPGGYLDSLKSEPLFPRARG